jgi:acyl transferase domain-containing protein
MTAMNNEALRRLMEEQLALSRRLKARVRELESEAHAPLAVVGMALRFPGGITTPEAYWEFLRGDADGLSEIPSDRPGLRAVYDPRPGQPGHAYVQRAGFLRDVAGFDARFFGISQREAEALDPQQRLLLEASWEAMERAGIPVRRGERLSAGVFVGIMASEYGERRAGQADKSAIDPYFGTGGGHCFAAGRVSYVMGFSGPAMSVDTACSSSLVALHLAAQSLRRRECRYALVGGTNMLFSGDLMVSLCQSRALAPDGRSKTFTAAADGYGRGEGVGVVALMRLDEAEREGRPVLAVLRGIAVNHDGASSGLTVPSGPAQQEVIRAALADGSIRPEEVGYVEAHGTGTVLGDPIEVGAIDATLGSAAAGRRAPLTIGNVKTRIGHLEAAAGIAGVIKVVLALHHGEIPAALSEADGPLNPMIPWQAMPITVPRRAVSWSPDLARRVAGVSAFGLSGTNAHALFEAYAPAAIPVVPAAPRRELVALSARDPAALLDLVRAVAPRLRGASDAELASLAHTLRAGRAVFPHRICVTGSTGAELAEALGRAAEGVGTPAGTAVPAVHLRLGGGDAVARGLEAIARAFLWREPEEDGVLSPDLRLDRFLRRLGLRTRILREDGASPVLAQLEWGDGVYPLVAAGAQAAPALFLDALAALFLAGADLRFDALRAPGARFVADLPTYPFRRERFWIDEPRAVAGLSEVAAAREGPGTPELLGRGAVQAFLEAELKGLLRTEGELDRTLSFLAVGGDSFIGMLLKKGIEQRFGVDVTLDALATETEMPLSALLPQLADEILQALVPAVEEIAA